MALSEPFVEVLGNAILELGQLTMSLSEVKEANPAQNAPPRTPRQERGTFGGTPVRTSGANPA